jgi:hypothetical protein
MTEMTKKDVRKKDTKTNKENPWAQGGRGSVETRRENDQRKEEGRETNTDDWWNDYTEERKGYKGLKPSNETTIRRKEYHRSAPYDHDARAGSAFGSFTSS